MPADKTAVIDDRSIVILSCPKFRGTCSTGPIYKYSAQLTSSRSALCELVIEGRAWLACCSHRVAPPDIWCEHDEALDSAQMNSFANI